MKKLCTCFIFAAMVSLGLDVTPAPAMDTNDRLLGKYIYRDIKLKAGLAINAFTVKVNGP